MGTATKHVCVIGAGIAGLVTAKVLLEDGFAVTVFDRAESVGGVWEPSRVYPGLRSNNSKYTYSFSDFPYPADADDFPTAEQIHRYLNAYVDHFGFRSCVQLQTSVEMVSQSAYGGFDVTVRKKGRPVALCHFDFVAVCNGVFHEPSIPEIEGTGLFTGGILHSSEVRSLADFTGKRVVVVGASKSGLDCANAASECSASTILLFRRAHWIFPRYLPDSKRRGEEFFFNRIIAAMSGYHKQSLLMKCFEGPLAPIAKWFWKLQKKMLISQVKVPPQMVPDLPLPEGLAFSGAGTDFFDALNAGKVSARRASIRRFCGGDLLELDSGETLQADIVVFATGWHQSVRFLDQEIQKVVRPARNFRLYRHILPPALPNLGFVGYASSLACQISSEVAAHWLSEHFLGRLALPGRETMEQEIDHVQKWAEQAVPGRSEGYFIGGALLPYADEIMEDLGLAKRRLANPLREYFGCFSAERYRDVGKERRARPQKNVSR